MRTYGRISRGDFWGSFNPYNQNTAGSALTPVSLYLLHPCSRAARIRPTEKHYFFTKYTSQITNTIPIKNPT